MKQNFLRYGRQGPVPAQIVPGSTKQMRLQDIQEGLAAGFVRERTASCISFQSSPHIITRPKTAGTYHPIKAATGKLREESVAPQGNLRPKSARNPEGLPPRGVRAGSKSWLSATMPLLAWAADSREHLQKDPSLLCTTSPHPAHERSKPRMNTNEHNYCQREMFQIVGCAWNTQPWHGLLEKALQKCARC